MPLMPGAQSFAHAGDDLGVVLLHGFTGSVASVLPWAQYFADHGHTVSAPRLPGHGTRWEDLNLTTWHDWFTEAQRCVAWVRQRSRTVVVMGISTGVALALRLAQTDEDISGVVGVNPIIQSERRDRRYAGALYRIVGSLPNLDDDIKRPGVSEHAYPRVPLKAAYSLTQLWAQTKSDIDAVTVPVLLFRSIDDHVAEPSNCVWLLANLPSEVTEIVLENSYHVATLDYDAPEIFADSLAFARRLRRP